MKKSIIYILTIILSLTLVVTAINQTQFNHVANAINFDPPDIPRPDTLPGPDTSADNTRKILIESVLPKFAVGFVGFVASLSLVFLIIGGVRFAMAYGNEEAIEKAKNQVIYSLVGLIIALLSYAIVSVIVNLKFSGDQTTNADNASSESNSSETTYLKNIKIS